MSRRDLVFLGLDTQTPPTPSAPKGFPGWSWSPWGSPFEKHPCTHTPAQQSRAKWTQSSPRGRMEITQQSRQLRGRGVPFSSSVPIPHPRPPQSHPGTSAPQPQVQGAGGGSLFGTWSGEGGGGNRASPRSPPLSSSPGPRVDSSWLTCTEPKAAAPLGVTTRSSTPVRTAS